MYDTVTFRGELVQIGGDYKYSVIITSIGKRGTQVKFCVRFISANSNKSNKNYVGVPVTRTSSTYPYSVPPFVFVVNRRAKEGLFAAAAGSEYW